MKKAIIDLIVGHERGKVFHNGCHCGCKKYYKFLGKKFYIYWVNGKLKKVGWENRPKMTLEEAFTRLERKRLFREQF